MKKYLKNNLRLVKEYNFNKNIDFQFDNLTSGSNKKVWWKCEKGHEWQAFIYSVLYGNGCPYCNNRKACHDNCLATTYPELAKEWSKKNKIKPTEVVSGSAKKVWWKCKKCNYGWITSVVTRINGCGCPICNESKGEKKVSKILDQLKIRYKREYKFKPLGQKRFDFAIFEKYKRKPFAVIEYQGKQHYMPVRFNGISDENAKINFQKTKKNDKIKKQFCKKNNIQYIEIKYDQINNIKKKINENLL